MNKNLEQIRKLVTNGNPGEAIRVFLDLTRENMEMGNQLSTLNARLKEVAKKDALGLIDYDEASKARNQITYSLLQLLTEYEAEYATKNRTVFISYNHNDGAVAKKIKAKLEDAGIAVTIDSEAMGPGEDIKTFINQSIGNTTTTLSIVSKNSLLSAWVAMETMNSYTHLALDAQKKFIPCYITGDFFDLKFTDEALQKINADLEEIAVIKVDRTNKGLDTKDINDKYSRLLTLKNSIDEIVGRLRNSLCMDITDAHFEESMQKVITKIKE